MKQNLSEPVYISAVNEKVFKEHIRWIETFKKLSTVSVVTYPLRLSPLLFEG